MRYEYYVDSPTGREYFKDIKEANKSAQKLANATGEAALRHDVDGGAAMFFPKR